MSIIYIKTEGEFDKLKETDKLLLVKFGATWCGPCKQIKSNLEKIAESEINNIIVIDIDVDEVQESDWSWVSEVENLPIFRFIRKGVQLDEYSGSNVEKIHDIIRKLYLSNFTFLIFFLTFSWTFFLTLFWVSQFMGHF